MDVKLICPEGQTIEYVRSLDGHVSDRAFTAALSEGRCFAITADGKNVGVLRYGLFWDTIPFLNLIYLEDGLRRGGIGSRALALWESMMSQQGHGMVMTSTQSDEEAQHFYRTMGYKDAGCLLLDCPGYEQPMEMFFTKAL